MPPWQRAKFLNEGYKRPVDSNIFYSITCVSTIFHFLFFHFTLKIILFWNLYLQLFGAHLWLPKAPNEANLNSEPYFFIWHSIFLFSKFQPSDKSKIPPAMRKPDRMTKTGANVCQRSASIIPWLKSNHIFFYNRRGLSEQQYLSTF